MEQPKEEVNNYSAEEKLNDSANIVNRYLVLGPPTMESSFEIGGSINSEEFEEGKRGDIYESTHSVPK